ncbi:MAG: hypothetical protein O2943_01570 [Actinomycetota bacterium]|nr:hypothetical protein [Actinomycetota bacterium]
MNKTRLLVDTSIWVNYLDDHQIGALGFLLDGIPGSTIDPDVDSW